MSDIIVTDKETLVVTISQPEHTNHFGGTNQAWSGSLECKRDNYTIDQIISHAGEAEFIERVLRIGGEGVQDITQEVIDYAYARGDRV